MDQQDSSDEGALAASRAANLEVVISSFLDSCAEPVKVCSTPAMPGRKRQYKFIGPKNVVAASPSEGIGKAATVAMCRYKGLMPEVFTQWPRKSTLLPD
jgi:hypothetical protein